MVIFATFCQLFCIRFTGVNNLSNRRLKSKTYGEKCSREGIVTIFSSAVVLRQWRQPVARGMVLSGPQSIF